MELCRPCIGLGCDNAPDLAAGIDGAIYSPVDYDFLIQCPDGCYCPPGVFPASIAILASTIPPVIPPILEPGADITLRLQGCQSLITRTLPAGSSQSDITAAAVSMQAEWAGQQAVCNALLIPGVNCTSTNSINVCNDEQSFMCLDVPTIVPAGTECARLSTDGLSDAQIESAIAALKITLNNRASSRICPFLGIVCTASFVIGPDLNNGFQLLVTNASATQSFDCAAITSHHRYGGAIILNQSGSGTIVAPGGVNVPVPSIGGIHAPTSDEVELFWFGRQFFAFTSGWSALMTISITVNCGTA